MAVPRITRMITRTGDDGTTALGSGRRVAKSSPRIAAYGTVDELNSSLGLALAHKPHERVAAELRRVQNDLLLAGADLCIPEADKARNPGPRIEPRHIEALEATITATQTDLPNLENFILPGGTPAAAQIQCARTICRRAERRIAKLAAEEEIGAQVLAYINRLSDTLFALARLENKLAGVNETLWDSRA